MALFDFMIPEGFLKQLGKLAEVEKYAPEMLKESAPLLVVSVKRRLTGVTRGGMGKMVESVGPSRVRHNSGGWWLEVFPKGEDNEYQTDDGPKTRQLPVRNAEKAAYLEYGTKSQSARPWLVSSAKDVAKEVINKMTEVFQREVSK
jgi:HK97 gp10 family phage protein